MQENYPVVSIIIPAYNMADLTAQTVESILAQTYKNIEIIVVDDGSKDKTRERMLSFDDKIKYVYKENGGACSARNVGIRMAQGEYIGLIDCDDLYLPNKVELCVNFLEKNPGCGFVYTDAYYIDINNQMIRRHSYARSKISGWIKEKLIISNVICNSTVILRKDCLEKTGLFDETIFPPADWDMWLKLSEHFKAGYIDQPLTKYRVTSSGCFNNMETTRRESLIVLDNFFRRNPDVSQRIKSKAYSRFHLSMVFYYIVVGDTKRLKEEYRQSISQNPFNLKAILLYFYYLLARENLKKRIAGHYYFMNV